MNDDATSLDRMHDIVLPEPIAWWPPAPGWYVLIAIVCVCAAYAAVRAWRYWRANAYRRAALHELETATSAAAISELLRRTALAVVPRSTVAAQFGSLWPKWLEAVAPGAMSERVRNQLEKGPYTCGDASSDVGELREYAAQWIKRHRPI